MNKETLKLLGLDEKEYKILKLKEEKVNGKILKIIEIKCIKKKQRCPSCNKFTSSIHDTLKSIKLKYLTIAGYNSEIYIIKRRFICHKCNKKFTESTNLNDNKSTISNKLKQKIRQDLLNYNLSMTYISKENNVSDVSVRNELLEVMNGYPNHVKNLPRVISIDEFKADTNYGKYACIINDPIHKESIDVLPSRKKDYLMNYFTKVENRNAVEYVISDMYEPYLLVTKVMFPKAKYVADRFHYIRHVMEALDDIRRRLQEHYGKGTKEYNMLKNKKNVTLLRKYYNDIDWYTYTKRYKNGHLVEMLRADILNKLLEISEELKRGYQLKELFLDIINHSTYNEVEVELLSWIDLVKESKIPEMISVGNMVETWLEYIVNSFIDERFSNGFTEGLNNKIKVIKRVGFGYKNFNFFRLRLLYILKGKISGRKNKNFKKSKI